MFGDVILMAQRFNRLFKGEQTGKVKAVKD
jgi:hypothetical protein